MSDGGSVDRRDLIALGLGVAAIPAVAGRAAAVAAAGPVPAWPPAESFALWPGTPPDAPPSLPTPRPEITGRAAGDYHDIFMRGTARPTVGVFRPARPDGRALLILPGGGYAFTSLRGEGMDIARALTPAGITAFVLSYRLPAEGWSNRANVPLSDAQRAMRLIRANARRFGIDPARLGVIGFSAGGHLAASLLTLHDVPVYAPIDAADRQSARPAFGGLMYAVSNVDPGRSHGGSRANLLGSSPAPGMQARYATDRHIDADTPPLFIAHALDDPTVPVVNGLDLFAAARGAGISCEAHFFERGGHGFGARLPDALPGSQWPRLFERWTRGKARP